MEIRMGISLTGAGWPIKQVKKVTATDRTGAVISGGKNTRANPKLIQTASVRTRSLPENTI